MAIAQLKKENSKMRSKSGAATQNSGFSKLEELMQKLAFSEKLNDELKREIAGFKRI